MDENNNVIPNGTAPENTSTSAASTDYIIGGPATPVAEPTPVVETTSTPEPTPAPTTSTADIYEQANDAAINPAPSKAEETPIYTTSGPAITYATDNHSAPNSTTYASTGATYSSSTYNSTTETTESKGLAIASLICGIASILLSCCCCGNILFSIGGIVCGILQKPMSDGKKPGMATAGIITSAVGIVLLIIMSILGAALGSTGMLDSLDSFNY